ncbi:29162_t:CDS:2 [Gigaspora margarita]|uniref:29162_t:CDS:1 n=1 Tax=Gigaspora margarita TaxID=4874 RepID=A0ABN7UFM8_GIGMA|nr:29162_t:CDS:2 [Gigaspora margarita]
MAYEIFLIMVSGFLDKPLTNEVNIDNVVFSSDLCNTNNCIL